MSARWPSRVPEHSDAQVLNDRRKIFSRKKVVLYSSLPRLHGEQQVKLLFKEDSDRLESVFEGRLQFTER